ncbi:MAG: MBL fold metallo-hydrolase [Saprospiraceae bacterium]|nr:MBL fold metallo-hydrolase [Saprospiraceae bacterium]
MRLTLIHAGYLKLDGGAMFGIIPKRMWEKLNPPDDKNLCTWSMRCLLIETADRKILVDTGMGEKQDARFRAHFEPHGQLSIVESLAQHNIEAEDITDVFLTHLHFDHCGGAIRSTPSVASSPTLQPTFPNAKYWSNAQHWAWAMSPNPREQASFFKENFVPLQDWGLLHFINDGEELTAGVKVHMQYGHTEAMMALEIKAGDKTFFYCADTIPSAWHIHLPFVMAYDVRPLDTLKEKNAILERAVTEGWYLIFEHDPIVECARIKKTDTGRFVVDTTYELKNLS